MSWFGNNKNKDNQPEEINQNNSHSPRLQQNAEGVQSQAKAAPGPQMTQQESKKSEPQLIIIDEENNRQLESEEVEPLITKSPLRNDAKSPSQESLENRKYLTLNDLRRDQQANSSNMSSNILKFAEGGDEDKVQANKKLCLCLPPMCIVIIFGLGLCLAFVYEVLVCIVLFYNDMMTSEYPGGYIIICGVYIIPVLMFFYFGCVDRFSDYMWVCFVFTTAAIINLWFFIWDVIYIFGYFPRPDVFLRQDMMWMETEWGSHGQDHGHAYVVQTKAQYFFLHGGLELLLTIIFGFVALNIYIVYRQ